MAVPFVDLKAQWAPLKPAIMADLEEAVNHTAFVGGKAVEEFETDFALYTGSGHAIGTSCGTAALTAILRGLKQGKTIPTIAIQLNTYVATFMAAKNAGYKIYPVDNWYSFIQHPPLVPDVILPVHMYGYVDLFLMDKLKSWAGFNGVHIVEDACQAVGAMGAGKFGIATAYSFYPAKNLGCWGQGGMITTDNPHLAQYVRSYTDHGRVSKYEHRVDGDNLVLDSLQAIVLKHGLTKLDEWNQARRDAALTYNNILTSIVNYTSKFAPMLLLESGASEFGENYVFHLYPILINDLSGHTRDSIKDTLNKVGIGAGSHYPISVIDQKPFEYLPSENTYGARRIARLNLTLPIGPTISNEQIEEVCDQLNKCF